MNANLEAELGQAQSEAESNESCKKGLETEATNLETSCAWLESQLAKTSLERSELKTATEEKARSRIDSLKEALVESEGKLQKLQTLKAAYNDLEVEVGVLRSELALAEAERDRLKYELHEVSFLFFNGKLSPLVGDTSPR